MAKTNKLQMEGSEATYNQLRNELDTVMADLEGGELDIDDAVKCYERGLSIVGQLEKYLKQAENRVTELKAAVSSGAEED